MSEKNNEASKSNNEENSSSSSTNTNPMLNDGITATIPIPRGTGITFRVRGSTITAASPPKFISLEEIMKAAHGVQDMALAHEIAVDQEFRLEPFEPPDNSYQKLVKDTMHRAFFDILREELNSDPPIFKQALVLLEDVKQGLFSILLPRHVRLREMIDEVLDQSFIRQQAENGAIEFQKYASFVIDLMGKLAAPCRDDMIQDITKLTDTIDIFRSILETLEVLKLDLANTLIAMIRPHVQAQSVQYEQQKFKEFLEVTEDGLKNTRAWLASNIDSSIEKPVESDGLFLRNTTSQVLSKAFLELLQWHPDKPYPETVQMDASRYFDLAKSLFKLVMSSCILLTSPTCGAPTDPRAMQFKTDLKNKITILMQDIHSDEQLPNVLPSIAEQIISDTDKLLVEFEQAPLNDDIKSTIRGQMIALSDPHHKVREIVCKRIYDFLKDILVCGGGSKQVPVGLSAFSSELTTIAATMLRLVMHNKAVFSHYYMDIVAAELDKI